MNCFMEKLESVQSNDALAMTGAVGGTNTEKLYQELGLELLQNRLKLCLFYKNCQSHTPPYLHNFILKNFQSSYSLRTTKEILLFRVKHGSFKSSFFFQ